MLNYQRVSLFKKLTKAGRFCMLTLSITAISRFIKGLISQHLNFKEPYLIFLRGIRPPNFSCSTSIFLQPTSANSYATPTSNHHQHGASSFRANAPAHSGHWEPHLSGEETHRPRPPFPSPPTLRGPPGRRPLFVRRDRVEKVGVYMDFTIWL